MLHSFYYTSLLILIILILVFKRFLIRRCAFVVCRFTFIFIMWECTFSIILFLIKTFLFFYWKLLFRWSLFNLMIYFWIAIIILFLIIILDIYILLSLFLILPFFNFFLKSSLCLNLYSRHSLSKYLIIKLYFPLILYTSCFILNFPLMLSLFLNFLIFIFDSFITIIVYFFTYDIEIQIRSALR